MMDRQTIRRMWSVTGNEEAGRLTMKYNHRQNAGFGSARNRGIQEMSREYVQYLDSGDRLDPIRLVVLANTIQQSGAGFIQTGFNAFDAETSMITETHYTRLKHDLVSQAFMRVVWPNRLRSAFRRTLVERVGSWNTETICFQDREYVERTILVAEKPIAIRDILASDRRGEARGLVIASVPMKDANSASFVKKALREAFRTGLMSATQLNRPLLRACTPLGFGAMPAVGRITERVVVTLPPA